MQRPAVKEPGRSAVGRQSFDVHESLKRLAFSTVGSSERDSANSSSNHFQKYRPGPQDTQGVCWYEFLLDSWVKNSETSDLSGGRFSWNVMVEGSGSREYLGSRYRLDTIVEARVGSFSLPILNDVLYYVTDPAAAAPEGSLALKANNYDALASGAAVPPTLFPNNAVSTAYGQYPWQVLLHNRYTRVPWINNPYTQLPNGNRLTIQLAESGEQGISDVGSFGAAGPSELGLSAAPANAYIVAHGTNYTPADYPLYGSAGSGARHHFDMSVGYYALFGGTNPNMCQAVPVDGGVYAYTDPIKSMESITLVFRSPDTPIAFLPDVYRGVTVTADAGGYLQFNVFNHQLRQGDRVFFDGFASGNYVLDEYVNRLEGHVAAGEPPPVAPLEPQQLIGAAGPSAPFFTDPAIGIGNLTPAPALPQRGVTVYVAARRLLIPLLLTGVVPRLTNYAGV
jgi:hypothetical protein